LIFGKHFVFILVKQKIIETRKIITFIIFGQRKEGKLLLLFIVGKRKQGIFFLLFW